MVSIRGSSRWSSVYRFARSRPLRTLALLSAAAAFVAASAAVVFYSGALLFGTESPLARTCPSDAAQFRPLPALDPPTAASGLSWGDYDNDGWDDLFVATAPSRLYANRSGRLINQTVAAGLPENLNAPSAVFADYDNDGRLDLLAVAADDTGTGHRLRLRVFRNAGNGTFGETTAALGLASGAVESDTGALALADFDSDGRLDIAAAFSGRLVRYRPPAGVSPSGRLQRERSYGPGAMRILCGRDQLEAAFGEDPDLAAAMEREFGTTSRFIERKGCLLVLLPLPPGLFSPLTRKVQIIALLPGEVRILRNAGTAFDVAYAMAPAGETYPLGDHRAASGLKPWPFVSGRFFQPVAFDANGDQRSDLFVATDFGRNLLLVNDGAFSFRDASAEYGFAIYGSGMGVALGDPSRDGVLDLLITNGGNLYHFRRTAGGFQLDHNESLNHLGLGWGIAFLDAENDGWSDLAIANSVDLLAYPDRGANLLHPTSFYHAAFSKDRFYANRRGAFRDETDRTVCTGTSPTYPLAVADFNNDGYEDYAVGGPEGLTLFENVGGDSHFLKVRLRGRRSNAFGVGATITVVAADGSQQTQLVAIGESFHSQHSLTKTFGLGSSAEPVTVRVAWPSGVTQRLNDATVDRVVEITEPDS